MKKINWDAPLISEDWEDVRLVYTMHDVSPETALTYRILMKIGMM